MKSNRESTLSFLNGCDENYRKFLTLFLAVYGRNDSPPIDYWPDLLYDFIVENDCEADFYLGVEVGAMIDVNGIDDGVLRLTDVTIEWLGDNHASNH